MDRVSVDALRAMKREGRKIAAIVCWDASTAAAADAAGVEIVSVGDSATPAVDELVVYCRAVRRGAERALVSCDLSEPSLDNARRLVEAGADLVKVADPAAVGPIAAAGIPVFAQLEGEDAVPRARGLEEAGAALLDFRHSGPVDGPKVVAAVSIPVLGGLGGGPWLDGRVRAVNRLLDEALAGYIEDVRAGRPVRGD